MGFLFCGGEDSLLGWPESSGLYYENLNDPFLATPSLVLLPVLLVEFVYLTRGKLQYL